MNATRSLIAALLAVTAIAASAQNTTTPHVDQRQANQEQRIDQGVASGALTAKETARLTQEQSAVDRVENKAKADGTVTKQERRRLAKMQNRSSRDIHRQKHDKQTAPRG